MPKTSNKFSTVFTSISSGRLLFFTECPTEIIYRWRRSYPFCDRYTLQIRLGQTPGTNIYGGNLFSLPKSTTGICSNGCTPTTVPYVETIAVQDDNVGVMPKAIAWLVNHTVANCFDVMAEQKCVW